ncbi:MAG TPA: hypothetical protein PKK06_16645 [Phycisphaerae bacterium]|nr:hypothetical protein [Phycisphaerae bacterium]HNU46930.1 hypothetical protein [Phycisphaerae bacterium]
MPELPIHAQPLPSHGRTRAFAVPLVLFVLALALWQGPWQFHSPVPEATVVPAWAIDPTPVRRPKLRPQIQLAGFSYTCSDCHRFFSSPPETIRSLTQHRNVELKHGINTRCFNCHHLTNRDALVDDWGREIPYDQPQLVCAKCHGPVYRDWLHGSHGRTNGYWDLTRGPQERRKCIECHDPHVPPFPPMPPAPPPSTLRMGEQGDGHHDDAVNPLRLRPSVTHEPAENPTVPDGGTEAEEYVP